MSSPERPFSLRSVALPAFLPTLLFSIGEGAIIPIIPIVADDLGATLAIAGFIGAMLMVGHLIGDIPSGSVVSRIGEKSAMIWASLLSVVGLIVCLVAPAPWVLGVGVLLIGLSTAVFALARHAFMTSFVPRYYRARALSTLGGTFRAGFFLGPFLSAGFIHLTGTPQVAFWIHILACLGAATVLLLIPDPMKTLRAHRVAGPDGVPTSEGGRFVAQEAHGLFRTVWTHRGVLVKLGGGAAMVSALRSGRGVMLPLWAVSIGISDSSTALIIGIAGGVDFALFYLSGQIMDRFGRLWSALPSVIGLSIGYFTLSLTHDLAANVQWFIVVAIFLSLANGIGSGILMTLGADLAPRGNPAPFLGAWRFTSDAGSAAAPLLIALLTAVASLSIASGVMSVFGLLGAGILARYVPRYAPWRGRDEPPRA